MRKLLAEIKRWVSDPEHHRRVALLAQTPLFAGLRKRLLGRVAARLFAKSYLAGEVVFEEGEPGRALYIVDKGAIEAFRRTPEGEALLARFEPPVAFGELALVDDLPRAATARAATDSQLLLLYRTHFDELLESDRAVALALSHRLLVTLARYVRARGGTHLPPAAAPQSPK